jgi:ribulose-5-phosphate 4-epimerase/fuculose-1-phosphate aldolase
MASPENELRQDVATANHIIEHFGLSNAFGHVSARIPGTNTFIFPTRRSPAFADASKLLLLDTDGNQLEGDGEPNSEFWIHARIYAARPDVEGVVHAHPPASVALTQIGQPHRVVHNMAGLYGPGIPEYERIGLIRSRELGDALVESLGGSNAVMMRGHGFAVAQPSVRRAAVAACWLEESADLNLRMLAAVGGDASKIRAFTREEAERESGQIEGPPAGRAWEYLAWCADGR